MARVSRRARGAARDGEPAHDRQAVRPARIDGRTRSRRGWTFASASRQPSRRSLRRAASRGTRSSSRSTSIRPARSGCARIHGAAVTACATRSNVARSSPPGWRSSTGATCPTRTSQRNSSSRLRSCTAGLPASTTSAARSSSRARCRGRRTTSCRRRRSSRAHARGTCWTTSALDQPVRDRTVSDIVALAPTRVDPAELPFPAPPGARVAVRVSPGITHTIGGLRIDEQARVVRYATACSPRAPMWAASRRVVTRAASPPRSSSDESAPRAALDRLVGTRRAEDRSAAAKARP